MNEKISVEHLKRAAYVYIRQSSSHQVRFHLEGQKRQYGLADRARQLGFHEVVVIDEDLGRSAGKYLVQRFKVQKFNDRLGLVGAVSLFGFSKLLSFHSAVSQIADEVADHAR